jgi:hypothetical protein
MPDCENRPQPEDDAEAKQQDNDQDWHEQLCETTAQTLRLLILAVVVVLVALILAVVGVPKEAWAIFNALGILFGG